MKRLLKSSVRTSILGLGLMAHTLMAVAAVTAEPAKSKWSSYQELDTKFSETPPKKDLTAANNIAGVLYSAFSYKVDANNSLTAETLNDIDYVGGFDIHHTFLRFYLHQNNVFSLPGWETGIRFRWAAPTSAGLQKAGGLGVLLVRPQIKKKMGALTFTIKEGLSIGLIEQGYEHYTENGAAPEAVSLVGNTLTLFPEYQITKKLSTGLEMNFASTYKGDPPGAAEAGFSHKFDYELTLAYDIAAATGGVLNAVILATTHESAVAKEGTDFKLFSKAQEYHLKIAKEF
jgi:hypothetical protein